MLEFPMVSFTIFLPLIGALFILFLVKGDEAEVAVNSKNCALWTSIMTFILSLTLLVNFDRHKPGFQLEQKLSWINGYDIYYNVGIDGISLILVILTTLLTPICILASWQAIEKRVKEYMVAFLLLETVVIGTFCALDLLLFYFFFEAVLIPMYLIIGIWGGQNRLYAAYKFFLYTLAGSVFMLLAIIYIYKVTGTTDIKLLSEKLPLLPFKVQVWLWVAFFASFAVKIPMWPFHTWLPDAHVQAPTAGSVILAGVLLKMGGYGFIRFSLPMLPEASIYLADFVIVLSIIAVIYASLVAYVQNDMKKLIAYSSIAHMGFVTAGIFSFNEQAISGAIIQMISHGLVSAALFLCVGVLYDRMHTREINDYGGVTNIMPKFSLYFMIFTMASVGLPVTSGFIGEFLVLLGLFQYSKVFAALCATGVVLGAIYMLYLYKKVMFGQITNKAIEGLYDLETREKIYFMPLILMVLILGIYPSLITDLIHQPVEELIKQLNVKVN